MTKDIKTYKEYSSSVLEIDDYKSIIEEARKEYNISINKDSFPDYEGIDIPFNLERQYFDLLLDNGKIEDATRLLDRMKLSYTSIDSHNFIENFEYRLRMIIQTDKLMQEKLTEAKKEFNQHTITLLSIIVGIIAIFGIASQSFYARNFNEGLLTFIVITTAIILLVLTTLFFNRRK